MSLVKREFDRCCWLFKSSNVTQSVSTLRAAIELKSVFDQIQAAEKAGNLTPEEKKRLEEQAAEKGLQALFKVNRESKDIYAKKNNNLN